MIYKAKHGSFYAGKIFLYHDPVAGISENSLSHHFVNGFFRFLPVLGDDHPFTGSQPVGLDDHRKAENADGVAKRFLVSKFPVARCGDVMTQQEGFGKGFAGFQPGAFLIGAEGRDPKGLQPVHNAHGKRHFRADHGKINGIFLCETADTIQILGFDGNALRRFCDPGVTGKAVDPAYLGTLGKLPADGVFSSAAAYH